jgi:hypothetical protein
VTHVGQKIAFRSRRFLRLSSRNLKILRVHLKFLFGAPPFDELSDLAADRIEQVEYIAVRFADFGTEEFNDAGNPSAPPDWKPEGAMQPFLQGDGGAWKFGSVTMSGSQQG